MDGSIEVLQHVVANLTDLKLDYFLVGPVASAQQRNSVRVTNNINMVMHIEPAQTKDFINRFILDEFHCPHFEVLYDEVKIQGSFQLMQQKAGVKINFVLRKSSELALSEFSRKTLLEVTPGFSVYVSTVEDAILKKLEFYKAGPSEQYLTDVRKLVYHNKLDQDYLNQWIKKLNLKDVWERASKN